MFKYGIIHSHQEKIKKYFFTYKEKYRIHIFECGGELVAGCCFNTPADEKEDKAVEINALELMLKTKLTESILEMDTMAFVHSCNACHSCTNVSLAVVTPKVLTLLKEYIRNLYTASFED
jgi:hypothetical protein